MGTTERYAMPPPTTNPQSKPDQDLQTPFANSIWYTLSLWPALQTAIANSWTPSASDKRDWLAATLADLFTTQPSTDHDDLCEVLLQVMSDEFGVDVEDDSEEVVAWEIIVLRRRIVGEGDLGALGEVEQRWKNRGRRKDEIVTVDDGTLELGSDEEWNGFEDEDGGVQIDAGNGDRDVEMGDAPALVPVARKEKPAPEVDDEGFTKVVGKKRR